jgi:hypothetical protein
MRCGLRRAGIKIDVQPVNVRAGVIFRLQAASGAKPVNPSAADKGGDVLL